jgi:hypothetical protein
MSLGGSAGPNKLGGKPGSLPTSIAGGIDGGGGVARGLGSAGGGSTGSVGNGAKVASPTGGVSDADTVSGDTTSGRFRSTGKALSAWNGSSGGVGSLLIACSTATRALSSGGVSGVGVSGASCRWLLSTAFSISSIVWSTGSDVFGSWCGSSGSGGSVNGVSGGGLGASTGSGSTGSGGGGTNWVSSLRSLLWSSLGWD